MDIFQAGQAHRRPVPRPGRALPAPRAQEAAGRAVRGPQHGRDGLQPGSRAPRGRGQEGQGHQDRRAVCRRTDGVRGPECDGRGGRLLVRRTESTNFVTFVVTLTGSFSDTTRKLQSWKHRVCDATKKQRQINLLFIVVSQGLCACQSGTDCEPNSLPASQKSLTKMRACLCFQISRHQRSAAPSSCHKFIIRSLNRQGNGRWCFELYSFPTAASSAPSVVGRRGSEPGKFCIFHTIPFQMSSRALRKLQGGLHDLPGAEQQDIDSGEASEVSMGPVRGGTFNAFQLVSSSLELWFLKRAERRNNATD